MSNTKSGNGKIKKKRVRYYISEMRLTKLGRVKYVKLYSGDSDLIVCIRNFEDPHFYSEMSAEEFLRFAGFSKVYGYYCQSLHETDVEYILRAFKPEYIQLEQYIVGYDSSFGDNLNEDWSTQWTSGLKGCRISKVNKLWIDSSEFSWVVMESVRELPVSVAEYIVELTPLDNSLFVTLNLQYMPFVTYELSPEVLPLLAKLVLARG